MKVAVLMSSYNGEDYIEEQINSVLAQKGCETYLIVRDDGSKDGTIDILKRYEYCGRLKWYTGKNLRPAQSFLHLLTHCGEFDYYAFCDQDDIWDEDKLIVAISQLKEYDGYALYHCNARLADSSGITNGGLVFSHVPFCTVEKDNLVNELMGGAIGCTMVMNRDLISVFQNYGVPDKVIMHDSFVQATCKALGGRVFFDGRPHISYRQHDNNVIGVKAGKWNGFLTKIKFITGQREVKVSDHANSILELYGTLIPKENVITVKQFAEYNKTLLQRIRLATSRRFRFSRIRDSIFMRFTILLGKR